MMIIASAKTLATYLSAVPPSTDTSFQGVGIDSRTIQPGNAFIAIRGDRFDGHDFVINASQNGAAIAIVDHPIDCPIPQVIVSDTTHALGKISQFWRDQFTLPVIGVTGSNGKTTLKNMIAAILREACDKPEEVLSTEGNFNNHIGLPLLLCRLNHQHQYAVVEMGMNHFGEIEYLAQLAKPTVAVINNAYPAHLEGVGNIEGVAQAKGEIFLGLHAQGTAILNRDDAFFDYWRNLLGDRKYLTFGLANTADVSAKLQQNNTFQLRTPQGEIEIALPLPGKHNVMNALAAAAATLALKINLATIQKGLESVIPAPGRMHPYQLPNNVIVIDDSYNANPGSVIAAANTLATFSGTKILILGDMKELGPHAEQIHAECGEKIRAIGIDYLLTYGNISAAATKAFGKNAEHFIEHEQVIVAVKKYLARDVIVLVKGSRSMQMEKIVAGMVPAENIEHAHSH